MVCVVGDVLQCLSNTSTGVHKQKSFFCSVDFMASGSVSQPMTP